MGKRQKKSKKSFSKYLKKRNKSILSSLNSSDDRNPDTYICVHCGLKKVHISFDELPNGKCPRRNDGGVHFWINCEKTGEKRVKILLQSNKPIDTEYMRYVAECYEMSGMKEEAIEWYQKILYISNQTDLVVLARVYELTNKKDEAINTYKKLAKEVAIPPLFTIYALPAIIPITNVMNQTSESNPDDSARRGYAYENGIAGVEKNYKKAIYWYKKSADMGNRFSMFALGILFSQGESKDLETALYYFRKAGEMEDEKKTILLTPIIPIIA